MRVLALFFLSSGLLWAPPALAQVGRTADVVHYDGCVCGDDCECGESRYFDQGTAEAFAFHNVVFPRPRAPGEADFVETVAAWLSIIRSEESREPAYLHLSGHTSAVEQTPRTNEMLAVVRVYATWR